MIEIIEGNIEGADDYTVKIKGNKAIVTFNELYRKKFWDNNISVKDFMRIKRSFLEKYFKSDLKVLSYDDDNEDDYMIFDYSIAFPANSDIETKLEKAFKEFDYKINNVSDKIEQIIKNAQE